jgi:hypothetical protein
MVQQAAGQQPVAVVDDALEQGLARALRCAAPDLPLANGGFTTVPMSATAV